MSTRDGRPLRRTVARTAILALVLGVTACAGQDDNQGDCNIALRYEGGRYEVHTALADPRLADRLGEPVGDADEVGCSDDPNVYGSVTALAVEGVSPDDVIAVVRADDGTRYVEAYLRSGLPRDRAPGGWPFPIPAEAWE